MSARIPGSYFARNLVNSKTLIFQLVKRDFQQRYVGSAAGWLWSIIHPFVLLVSYVFVFQSMHGELGGELKNHFPLYLFAGMLPWLLFSETLLRSSGSIVEHANLITKTMFPSEILPVAVFLSSLVSHAIVVLIVAVSAASVLGHGNPALALLVVYVPIVGLFAIGAGWVAAALQVYLRDTVQVVAVITTFWFWLTPIFLQEKDFEGRHIGWALRWNPMAYVVRGYRQMLLAQGAPPLHDVCLAAGFAILTFVLGGLFFRHMKKGFADVL